MTARPPKGDSSHNDASQSDPALHARVQASFDAQGLMHTLGAQLLQVREGEVQIALPFAAMLSQQHGFLHAATSIVDSACGYAALTKTPASSEIVTAEFKLNLLRPALGERFVATGRGARLHRRPAQADRVDAGHHVGSAPGLSRFGHSCPKRCTFAAKVTRVLPCCLRPHTQGAVHGTCSHLQHAKLMPLVCHAEPAQRTAHGRTRLSQ